MKKKMMIEEEEMMTMMMQKDGNWNYSQNPNKTALKYQLSLKVEQTPEKDRGKPITKTLVQFQSEGGLAKWGG